MILKADRKSIRIAAKIIKDGGVVAFPTETVYGLGANVFDVKAVRKIFALKGRPADNPLIVHIRDMKDLWQIAKREARSERLVKELTARFWPGPLTLILFKKKIIPSEVSAGLETVAVRMPKHRAALSLIREAGVPIAAPSANISGRPSAVTAQQVARDFGDKIDCILDGGRSSLGVESTVLDITVFPPVILRQGGLPIEKLKKVLSGVYSNKESEYKVAKSPGMKHRHYAPSAPLLLSSDLQGEIKKYQGKKIGILISEESRGRYAGFFKEVVLGSKDDLRECARNLFTALRKFDNLKVDIIISEIFPERGLGAAVMERLRKAARGK